MVSIFHRSKPIIGLDISRTSIRAMSVNPGKTLVKGYGSIELDPEETKENSKEASSYLAKKLQELFSSKIIGDIGGGRAIVGIPTDRTFVRTFSLPLSGDINIKSAINIEVEQYIPMPLEALYVDHKVIKKTDKEQTVLICAVAKKYVDSIITATKQAGIEVEMIEPGISSVSRLLEATEDGMLPTIIVDIGPASTDIAILASEVRITGGLNIGGNTLTLDIAKKLNIPLETAHQLKVLSGLNVGPKQAKITAAISPSLKRIISEAQKVIRYYTNRFPNEDKLEQVLLVGSGSNVPGIGDFFTDNLLMPARTASPWQSLDFGNLDKPAKQLRPRYITVAGLALVNPDRIWS